MHRSIHTHTHTQQKQRQADGPGASEGKHLPVSLTVGLSELVQVDGGFGIMCCCCCEVASVVPDSVRPHRWQPTRLLCPWDFPGKNTGVGCRWADLICDHPLGWCISGSVLPWTYGITSLIMIRRWWFLFSSSPCNKCHDKVWNTVLWFTGRWLAQDLRTQALGTTVLFKSQLFYMLPCDLD